MKKYIQDYVSDFEKDLNISIMNKEYDEPLVDYVLDCLKSLEVLSSIKIVGYDYSEKESEIDINKYIFKREKKKKKKERYDYKFIHDTRVGKLTVYVEVSIKETNKETGEVYIHKYPIKKVILVPLKDENGHFYIKGKPYYMIYQVVEKSTYTSKSSVVLKSLMPVTVKRGIIENDETFADNLADEELKAAGIDCTDTDNIHYTLPVYYIFVLKKEIPIMLFYLSRGIYDALDFLGMNHIISFVTKLPEDVEEYDNHVYFQISKKCYLRVVRSLFDKYTYVRSVVGGILNVSSNRTTIESLNDPKVWIKKIAVPNNYEKGKDILKFFNRLCDETTKKILKVHPYHRHNIYTILRWMMMQFNELRMKDNLDLSTKRLRDNEYVASLLTIELSRRLNRVLSLGEKATIDNYRELFKFPGDILIQKMHNSGVLRFNDNVNDMGFFSKFKYTNKGPHSLGSKNSNNIGIRYRGIHPSHLSKLDIFVCGNSDPGTSGLLSPFSDMESFYFDDSNEEDGKLFEINQDIEKMMEEQGKIYISPRFDSKDDFYTALQKMDELEEQIVIHGESKEGEIATIESRMIDMDEESTISVTKKKKKKKDGENEENNDN